jgi:carbon monoxide dehydrogenase subunit G
MEFAGQLVVAAPRDRVWAYVADPEQVGWCGPGVEAIDAVDATHFTARARVGVGVISTRFGVELELATAEAPDLAVIRATGHAPGSAVDATGEMRLSGPPDGPTTLDWHATVALSGTIASVGARLIEGTATKLIGQAFDCIKSRLEEPGSGQSGRET